MRHVQITIGKKSLRLTIAELIALSHSMGVLDSWWLGYHSDKFARRGVVACIQRVGRNGKVYLEDKRELEEDPDMFQVPIYEPRAQQEPEPDQPPAPPQPVEPRKPDVKRLENLAKEVAHVEAKLASRDFKPKEIPGLTYRLELLNEAIAEENRV